MIEEIVGVVSAVLGDKLTTVKITFTSRINVIYAKRALSKMCILNKLEKGALLKLLFYYFNYYKLCCLLI